MNILQRIFPKREEPCATVCLLCYKEQCTLTIQKLQYFIDRYELRRIDRPNYFCMCLTQVNRKGQEKVLTKYRIEKVPKDFEKLANVGRDIVEKTISRWKRR